MSEHSPSQVAFLAAYQRHTAGYEIHAPRPVCGQQECECEECPEDEACSDASHAHEHTDACCEDEGVFSWSPCDTCGSRLGGDRYAYALTNSGLSADGTRHDIVEVESCVDCVMFAANGELPEDWR